MSKKDIQTHKLKIWPKYYLAVSNGLKTFECRINDRDFREDDFVVLKEFNPETQAYTGNELTFKIGYVLHLSHFFGTDNKAVIFSLLEPI